MSKKKDILKKIPPSGEIVCARFKVDTNPQFCYYTVMYKSSETVVLRLEDCEKPFEIAYDADELVEFGIEIKGA